MKRIITVHMFLRLLPIALLGALLLIERFSEASDGRAFRLCCYLVASIVLYLIYPHTRDDASVSVRTAVVASVYYLVACLMLRGRNIADYLFLMPSAGFVVAYACTCIIKKYNEPAAVFRKDAAWCCAEEDSRYFYSLIFLVLVAALIVLNYEQVNDAVYICFTIILACLAAVLHWRVYSGHTVLIGRKKEKRIQTIMMAHGHYADIVPEIESSILAKAYKRIEQFMREHKPYLDERFSLEKMSELLKMNKVYISRAVNKYTSKNFRQYVNWHRILYSVELMKADPWLKVIELAFMSGFHSQVTYNLCFKMFMDQTPSDVLARLRLNNPRPEASTMMVELPSDEVLPCSPDEPS